MFAGFAGFARLWLAVGITLAVLALAEGIARIAVAPRARPADDRIHADSYPREPWVAELYEENAQSARVRWEPFAYWRRLPFAGRHIHIDADGLRRTWRPATGGAGPPLRIFFFGGSAAWGTGVRDDGTIPSALARYLAAAGVRAEILNFGETGYVSTQEVIALLRRLQAGDVPDLAIFYFGINDTLSALQSRAAGLSPNEDHRAREFNLLLHARRLVREALRVFAARSALVRLCGLAAPPPAPPAAPSPRLVEETLRAVDANLRAADGLAASYGFRTSFFWEPCLVEKRRLTPYEQGRAKRLAGYRDGLLATYSRVARGWAGRDRDRFTYLGDLFAGVALPRFIDHVHTGEAADREVAAAIGRQLVDHGRLRFRAGSALVASIAG